MVPFLQRQSRAALDPAAVSSLLTGIVAYWKCDEASGNLLDSVGSNHLTTSNVGSTTGKIGNCRDWDLSTSSNALINDNADLSMGDIDFSICAWVNLKSKPASVMNIVCKRQNENNPHGLEYWIRWINTSDRFEFLVSNNGEVGGMTTLTATNFGAPSLATWYFIAARHDAAANVISISVNDGTPNTASHSGGAYDGTEKFGIGNTAFPNGYFDGQIDEVGLWKRYLTDAEITTLYNGGTGKTHPFS